MAADNTKQENKAQRWEYFVVTILCAFLLGMLGVLWLRQQGFFQSAPVVEHTPTKRVERPIEVNSARWWELTQIRGIGEKRAKEIIALRERKNGFGSIDELAEVRGITPVILERIRAKARVAPR